MKRFMRIRELIGGRPPGLAAGAHTTCRAANLLSMGGKMNKDIRIDLSFSNHRKRKKLFCLLGAQGVLSLIDLWLKAAESRPKGILIGMDEIDIALDAQWNGDPAEFCKALCNIGFLDRTQDGTYSIHDWPEHQPFAYYADERTQRAKELAAIRWSKKNATEENGVRGNNTDSMQDACETHAEGNAPSPSPSPIPLKPSLSFAKSQMTCPQSEIVDLYHKILPELSPVKSWTEERQAHLRARWKEEAKRQDLDWWKRYFEYIRESPFLMGNGSKGWKPNLEWLVRKKNFINLIEGKYHAK